MTKLRAGITALSALLVLGAAWLIASQLHAISPREAQRTKASATPLPSTDPNRNTLDTQPVSIWAGYVAKNETFNSVEGRVVVPQLDCTAQDQSTFGAWVGFDGYPTGTVEQAGITAVCGEALSMPLVNGASYYAWSALHGAGKYKTYPFRVSPGNQIFYKVSVSNNVYTLTVKNETTGESGSDTQACVPDAGSVALGRGGCTQDYVEWIVERPGSNKLANFGSATLFDNVATSTRHSQRPIGEFDNTRVNMFTPDVGLYSQTGDLGPSGAFTVDWLRKGGTGE